LAYGQFPTTLKPTDTARRLAKVPCEKACAIDAGNTDIVFGLHDGNDWLHHWRMPSRTEPSQAAWQYRLVSELLEIGHKPAAIQGAIISSVVPALTNPLREMLALVIGREPWVLDAKLFPRLSVKVINTEEIGADLVANAAAAYARFKSKCVVVDFGTALTFTTIAADGTILGVAIAPGLKTAIRALFTHTAQLPEVPLERPHSVLGKNTIHAIQAGVVVGYTGMVKHLLSVIKTEIGDDCTTIATGGLSSVLTDLDEVFDHKDRMLTMDGLISIAQQLSES
ncbi:MAG: type III pantothenate kinase, partial [Bacteroidota bacterium]